MSDTLNIKQEKFVQYIINGLSQRQAYKEAYGVEYDDNAIDINASKLFNSTKVKLRYEQLVQELEDKSIMTAKERMKWLTDVVKGNIKQTSYNGNGETFENEAYISDKLKAIDTLNKMSGEYTTKVDANVNTEIKVTIED